MLNVFHIFLETRIGTYAEYYCIFKQSMKWLYIRRSITLDSTGSTDIGWYADILLSSTLFGIIPSTSNRIPTRG